MSRIPLSLLLGAAAIAFTVPAAQANDPHSAQEAPVEQEQSSAEFDVDDPALAEVLSEGERLFEKNCARCHSSDLSGGTGPALADNESVGEDGLVVRMMVFGGSFMPAFGRLSDADMAAIATYVRNTHGNDYGAVTIEDVEAAR